jgi:TPR repeat protein
MIECEKCAAEVAEESTVCPQCGAPVMAAVGEMPERQTSGTGKSRLLLIGGLAVGVMGVSLFLAWMGTRKGKETPPNAPPQANLEELRAKAEQGDAEAEKNLGKLYAHGEQVPQSYAEAAKWYRQSAEQGNAGAQIALGELYEAGRGVPRDDAETAKWYRRAAESGDADGQYRLAVLYVMGQGVTPDNAEALKWYRQSADGGLALAQYNLGMRYFEGKGVTPDPIEAYKWLALAGAQGIPDANSALQLLRGRMNREQIDEAKRRVKAFTTKKAA